MKTITIIAAILSLQVSSLFANNDFPPTVEKNDVNTSYIVSLTPTTPSEATFENDATVDIYQLMPLTPTEATFEDMPYENTTIIDLAPVTPIVADFSDTVDVIANNYNSLAPVTPTEADFE